MRSGIGPILAVAAALTGMAGFAQGGSTVATLQALAASASCTPTRPDILGPFYKPNAPARSSVGRGHVLKGTVRSAAGCAFIPGARIELWLAGPNGRYDDEHRASVIADPAGAYRLESNYPAGYGGRPPHIHIKVTADRHETLITQYYPAPNEAEGTLDLVLVAAR